MSLNSGATPYDATVRVLVVEDEAKMATLVRKALELEGYSVDVAMTGTDAVWMGTENEYDAIVLDVMIPEPDGFEVCRRLRADGIRVPVVYLTARDATEDKVRGLTIGADDYIPKPFSFAELYARLRALTRRGAPERPRVLEVADLELDPARHRVTRAGQEVDLSPKEFALLDLFMRHADEVLSRTTILEHVWDFAYDGTSNVVDVYVRYLREKIDRPFERTTLETVRGVGYRLRVDG